MSQRLSAAEVWVPWIWVTPNRSWDRQWQTVSYPTPPKCSQSPLLSYPALIENPHLIGTKWTFEPCRQVYSACSIKPHFRLFDCVTTCRDDQRPDCHQRSSLRRGATRSAYGRSAIPGSHCRLPESGHRRRCRG